MFKTAVITAVIATAISLALTFAGVALCGGEFAYPLDDACIHAALARELVESGTWGFDPGISAFASSSPLWTVLLAILFKLTGFHDWWPLVLAHVCGSLSIFAATSFLLRTGMSRKGAVWSGLAVALVMPYCIMVNLGMEHALHFLGIALLLAASLEILQSNREQSSKTPYFTLAAGAFIAAGARYESAFLIAPLLLLFLGCRRWRAAAVTAVAAALPPLAYGLYAVAHGGPFLPMSMLLKVNVGAMTPFSLIAVFYSAVSADTVHVYIWLLLLLLAAIFARRLPELRRLALALSAAIVGHVLLARLGWMYRYEAYLVGAAVMILAPFAASALRSLMPAGTDFDARLRRLTLAALLLILATPIVVRAFSAHVDTIFAAREIHAQQYQMARLFATLPENQRGAIAVNDLGAVALYAGAHVLDIWGLGSADVAELKRAGAFSADASAELFRKHKIRYAAFYPNMYDMRFLSPDLRLVAVLELRCQRIICGGQQVFLCVTHPEDVAPFRAHLQNFATSLPENARMLFVEE